MKNPPLLTAPVKGFSLRNVWPLFTGELAVREGLSRMVISTQTRTVRGGFSVPNEATGEPFHYFLEQNDDAEAFITVYDADYVLVQTFATGSVAAVEVITHGVINGELMIASPSFATLWSPVGGTLQVAEKVASSIPDRIIEEIPRGIMTSWAGRAVIASGLGLYISDALAPRTFDPVNVSNPPGGQIFGLHVAAGGALVIATAEGVWALPEDAASSADVYAVWSQLTSERFNSYNSTANVKGVLYGLTSRGYRRIDSESAPETYCNEPVTGVYDPDWVPVSVPDYRRTRILAGDKGPIVAASGRILMVDETRDITSWWALTPILAMQLDVVGIQVETDGSIVYVATDGVWRYGGSYDTDNVTTADAPQGSLVGRLPARPDGSVVVRHIDHMTDSNGPVDHAVPGAVYEFESLPQSGVILNLSEWGTTYAESLMRGARSNFAQRLDEVDVGVKIYRPGARLGVTVGVTVKGPGKTRRGA